MEFTVRNTKVGSEGMEVGVRETQDLTIQGEGGEVKNNLLGFLYKMVKQLLFHKMFRLFELFTL